MTGDEAVRKLARALCDTSSHVNLMPHDEQRPCRYHLDRARATLLALARVRVSLVEVLPVQRAPLELNPERDPEAERSRLDAEHLRSRVPPIRVQP